MSTVKNRIRMVEAGIYKEMLLGTECYEHAVTFVRDRCSNTYVNPSVESMARLEHTVEHIIEYSEDYSVETFFDHSHAGFCLYYHYSNVLNEWQQARAEQELDQELERELEQMTKAAVQEQAERNAYYAARGLGRDSNGQEGGDFYG